jgi:glycosyltransferase involved in cell wall biosynthesis
MRANSRGAGRPKLLYLVTEDWYFCSHRMDLARAARDSGYNVIVATQVSDHADEITREGFKLVPIQLSRRNRDPIADLADIIELVGIYREEKPDIVHHVGMKPIVYGSWAARYLRQVAVVNSFAGLGYVFTGTKRSTRIARGAVVFMMKSTRGGSSYRRSIFQNKDDFEALRACGLVALKDASIVPGSGVAEEKFVPAPEAPGDPMVLLAGRVLGDKGVAEFVEAATIIKNRGIKARFVVAGRTDPANPSSIPDAQLQKWQAAGIIEWWGQRNDMPAVLAQSHIVALPSYREGFPKILLEAGASKRPVVATDVPGCREIVRDGENGFLVPVRDAKALAEALIKLIEDRELRIRMGARGREIVLSGLTSSQIIPQVLSVYGDLLQGMRSVN